MFRSERMYLVYLWLLPTFIFVAIFSYYPAFSALWHSFYKWEYGLKPEFVGLKNFIKIFHDEANIIGVQNLVKIVLFNLMTSLVVPILVAHLIFSLKKESHRYWYRLLFIIPMIIPGVVNTLVWRFIYSTEGIINQILNVLGLSQYAISWLSNYDTALYAIMVMGFPWVRALNLLIVYAGLINIPGSVFDAAEIDGAGEIKKLFKIEIPLIMGQIKLLIVLTIINNIQIFQHILILTNGGPGYATMVPGLNMYNSAFVFGKVGYACAIGTVLFIVILLLTIINMKYIKTSE